MRKLGVREPGVRQLRVRAALALLPVLASLAGAGAGQAHNLINSGNVYDNGSQCVFNWTAQAHTYNSVVVRSLTDTPPFHFPIATCTYNNAKPSGYLAGRWESWKWGPNVAAWLVCGTQGWNYGGGNELQVGRGTTGCGGGYYLLQGGAFVYNGGWVGGWLATNYEWLWS